MLTVMRHWRARRRLRIAVGTAGDGALNASVVNVSGRTVTIQHVGLAWPYRRVRLHRKLKSFFQHGHHWPTIGWTHQRLTELDRVLGLPLTLQPAQQTHFDLPLNSARGAWEDGQLTFVVRIRDSRGRNYYSPVVRLAR